MEVIAVDANSPDKPYSAGDDARKGRYSCMPCPT